MTEQDAETLASGCRNAPAEGVKSLLVVSFYKRTKPKLTHTHTCSSYVIPLDVVTFCGSKLRIRQRWGW